MWKEAFSWQLLPTRGYGEKEKRFLKLVVPAQCRQDFVRFLTRAGFLQRTRTILSSNELCEKKQQGEKR